MCLAYWLLVVVVLGFELYLQFKLQFKPSTYLYLRTSLKTKDHHLGLLQSLLVFHPISHHSLAKRPCQCSYYKGSQVPSCLVLVSRSVLVLGQPSDVSDLVPSRLVSINPAKSHIFCHTTICLSQVYGCSDHYTMSGMQHTEGDPTALLSGMPHVHAQKKKAKAEERWIGGKICGDSCDDYGRR